MIDDVCSEDAHSELVGQFLSVALHLHIERENHGPPAQHSTAQQSSVLKAKVQVVSTELQLQSQSLVRLMGLCGEEKEDERAERSALSVLLEHHGGLHDVALVDRPDVYP